MTLAEAAKAEIARVRLTQWANADAYLKIDLFPGGMCGPWAHLYERKTQEAIGESTPQNLLTMYADCPDFVPYSGPLDKDDV